MKAKIKKWYQHGVWSIENVRNAVVKGIITEADYYEITGEEY